MLVGSIRCRQICKTQFNDQVICLLTDNKKNRIRTNILMPWHFDEGPLAHIKERLIGPDAKVFGRNRIIKGYLNPTMSGLVAKNQKSSTGISPPTAPSHPISSSTENAVVAVQQKASSGMPEVLWHGAMMWYLQTETEDINDEAKVFAVATSPKGMLAIPQSA